MPSFLFGIVWLTRSFTFPLSQLPTKKPIESVSKIVLSLSMSNVAAPSKDGNLVGSAAVSVAVVIQGNSLSGPVLAHHPVLVSKEVASEAALVVVVEGSAAAFVATEEVGLATEEDSVVTEEVDLVIEEDSVEGVKLRKTRFAHA